MTRDLLHQDEIRELVRDAYRAVDGGSRAVAEKLYSSEELALVPASAIEGALGVANHLRYAHVEPGDTVLDLGCGSGIDSVLAGHRAGPTGRVLALDFLPEMLERTAAAAGAAGLDTSRPSSARWRRSRSRTRASTAALERGRQPLPTKGAGAGRVCASSPAWRRALPGRRPSRGHRASARGADPSGGLGGVSSRRADGA